MKLLYGQYTWPIYIVQYKFRNRSVHSLMWAYIPTLKLILALVTSPETRSQTKQEAQLSQRDRATRNVSWNVVSSSSTSVRKSHL